MNRTLLSIGTAALLFGACAHAPPTEQLQSSSAAVRAAEEVGAQKEPKAALHLQLAKEQTERAQKMLKDGNREDGEMLLVRAEADANLAVALARTSQEQADAQGAADKVRSLQQAPR